MNNIPSCAPVVAWQHMISKNVRLSISSSVGRTSVHYIDCQSMIAYMYTFSHIGCAPNNLKFEIVSNERHDKFSSGKFPRISQIYSCKINIIPKKIIDYVYTS